MRLALIPLLILSLFAGPRAALAADLTVFAAASLKTALDPVAHAYETATGDRVALSFAGSAALARQIEAGAPADIFISANLDWMDHLERQNLIDVDSRRVVLRNTLVLVAASDWSGELTPAPGFALADHLGPDTRLAMALVDAVPAGQYGKQALGALGVWDAVAPHVVQANDVRAALRLVHLGEAPLGIVYATDALADPTVRVLGPFPQDSYGPVRYPAAALTEGNVMAARQFLDALTSPIAVEIFQSQGFAPPEAAE